MDTGKSLDKPTFNQLIRLPLECLDLPGHAYTQLKALEIRTIGHLICLGETGLSQIPGYGNKKIVCVKRHLSKIGFTLLPDSDISPCELSPLSLRELRGKPKAIMERFARSQLGLNKIETPYVEAELDQILIKLTNDPRVAEILKRLWGWNDKGPQTLQTIGDQFGITRERVRQLSAKAIARLDHLLVRPKKLLNTIYLMEKLVPNSSEQLSRQLVKLRITKSKLNPLGLLKAAEIFQIPISISAEKINGRTILIPSNTAVTFSKVKVSARKLTSSGGCFHIYDLTSSLDLEEKNMNLVRTFISSSSEFVWLDDGHWAYSKFPRRNRLENLILKVLHVAPEIRVSELRRAIGRNYRLKVIPPSTIISDFCQARGIGVVTNDIVYPNEPHSQGKLSRTEKFFFKMFNETPNPMTTREIEEKCISHGIGLPSLYQCLSCSPLVTRISQGVYGLVGKNYDPVKIEEIRRLKGEKKSLSDYGWADQGNLWYAFQLTLTSLHSGSIHLPTFVYRLVKGRWDCKIARSATLFPLKCENHFLWNIRKPLKLLEAEPEDLCVLTFSLTNRIVEISISGLDKLDSLREKES